MESSIVLNGSGDLGLLPMEFGIGCGNQELHRIRFRMGSRIRC